jgi:ATP-binding cassette subfamily C protein CydC
MSSGSAIRELLGDQAERAPAGRGLAKPAATVVLAFSLGAGLLALAGWFIAASAVAGLALASTFSFLFPSAGVQALAWARTLARYRERISTHEATLDLVGSLRTSLFARALHLPRDRVSELRTSELLGRITVDSDAVENLLLRSSFPILAAIAALIGTAAMFATLSIALAIVAVAGLVLASGVLVGLAYRQSGQPARRFVAARADVRRTLIETLDGLPELRSFGAEQRAVASATRQLELFGQSRRQLTRLAARGQSIGTFLADLTLLAVTLTAAGLIGTRALPVPAFVAVCLVAIAVFEPVVGLPGAVTARARARAACARLTDLFPSSPTTKPAAAPPLVPTLQHMTQLGLKHHDIELPLAHGDTVLLTGASGTGKSTILRAISARPEHVTLVAQDAHVFDGTIRENLKLADPVAAEPELWRALAAAALDDTVAMFPAGLDTPVGPGGAALSGGQRRRLSVAQGLLRHADVLLLDEPTEALDAPTATRLLAGVRDFDPCAALVIALHDRQSLDLPWTPIARVELAGSEDLDTVSRALISGDGERACHREPWWTGLRSSSPRAPRS